MTPSDKITNLRHAFVAWTNTDLTEGRGWQIPLAVCETEATAIRLGKKGSIMGSDCAVTKVEVFRISGVWYGPIQLVRPSDEDKNEQSRIDARRAAIEKAKAAGLSDEDIAALRHAGQ